MDETKELALEKLDVSPDLGHRLEVERQRLSTAARELLGTGDRTERAAAFAIETILPLTRFERGFILVTSVDANGTVSALRPLAARELRDQRWTDVPNPEFAVIYTVVARALASGSLLTIGDALLQPTRDGESTPRTVLCFPFELTSNETGVLYLDRALGGGDVSSEELFLFREFVERCLLLVARSYALRELGRARASASAGTESGATSEPGTASVADEDGAEAPAGDAEDDIPDFYGIVGRDPKLTKLIDVVGKVKDNDLSLCIIGESGTGKELLARAIHRAGARSEANFVGENCGAITESLLESELFGHVKGAFTGADEDRQGLFEVANGGTLFLDEIGDMSEGMQRKLLRVLQEGVIRPIGGKDSVKVDVRVISASNRDLKALVDKGTFRADLFYRLNVITLELPPLRERAGDIPLLIRKFTSEVCREEGVRRQFSESALTALEQYSWPGNVRELRNLVRRVVLTSKRRVIARKEVAEFLQLEGPVAHSGENIYRDDSHVVLRIPARDTFNGLIDECERLILEHALGECSWNKSKVTKVLKIPRQSLYNKIAKYDLQRKWGDE